MRSGMWILAACGIAGMAFSAGIADEVVPERRPFALSEPGTPRTIQYFSKGGRTVTQTAAESEPAEAADAGRVPPTPSGQLPTRYTRRPETLAPAAEPKPVSGKPLPGVTNYRNELFGGERSAATEFPAREDSDELIHAEYNRVQGIPARGQVQQVGAGGEFAVEPSPFGRPQPSSAAVADDEPNPFASAAPVADSPARSTGPLGKGPLAGTPANLPTGPAGPQTPMVNIRWNKRSEIVVGQPCECELIVKNSGKIVAKDVVVEAYFPQSVRLTKAAPQPLDQGDYLSWQFPALAPEEEQTIRISLIPSQQGELTTTAFVRFTGAATGRFHVEEPKLELAVKGANEVQAGDLAPQIITVSNPGTGVAHNVLLEARIPKGLEHPRGERLVMDLGSLNPGESRQVRLALAAVEGGRYNVPIEARGDAGLRQSLTADLLVIAPSITIGVDGPSLRYIGRTALYEISVTNDGTAASNNVRVTHKLPEGFQFQQADNGGTHDPFSGTTSWFVGRLEAEQSVQLKLELAPTKLGSYQHQVAAVSEQGARAEAQVETQVDGSASLALEIVNLNDPVEVGTETVYEVRVRNAGTKAARNVGLACEMAAALEFLSAKGPTEHQVQDRVIHFQTVQELDPGKVALYRIHVRGQQAGTHRFRTRLASDSLEEPLIFEEATKFYAD